MSRAMYLLVASVIFILVIAFPVYQLIESSGLLFYTNGWDEASYLQYDYAAHVLEVAGSGRGAQLFVVALHNMGLSGGAINLLFDAITTIMILTLVPSVLIGAQMEPGRAYATTIGILGVPLILSNFNPLYDLLQHTHMEGPSLKYLTAPFIHAPVWLRTPEPQLSLMGALVLVRLSQKLRYASLLIPLFSLVAYPFVGVPLLHCSLTQLVSKRFELSIGRALTLSWISISALLFLYHSILIPPPVQGYIVPTHFPLLSLCGVIGGCLLIRKRVPRAPQSFYHNPINIGSADDIRMLSLILVSSIWFAANFQIVAGFTIQPNNFEQYWSATTLVFVGMLVSSDQRLMRNSAYASIALLTLWSLVNAVDNLRTMNKIELSKKLLHDINTEARWVAINDIRVSTRLDMLYPRQAPLLFSYTRFYKGLPTRFIDDFLCAKQELANQPAFAMTLAEAEALFRNGDKNYVMNTILRVFHPAPDVDLKKEVSGCNVRAYVTRE